MTIIQNPLTKINIYINKETPISDNLKINQRDNNHNSTINRKKDLHNQKKCLKITTILYHLIMIIM